MKRFHPLPQGAASALAQLAPAEQEALEKMEIAVVLHRVGDALGAVVELQSCMKPPEQPGLPLKRRKVTECPAKLHGDWYIYMRSRWGVETKFTAGAGSDDSEATAELLHNLANMPEGLGEGEMREELIDGKILWATSGCLSIGKNTRDLLDCSKAKTRNKRLEQYWKCFERRFPNAATQEGARSNGALMRSLAHVCLPTGDLRQRLDVHVTNPSQLTNNVVEAYVRIIKECLWQEQKPFVFRTCLLQQISFWEERGDAEVANALKDGSQKNFVRDVRKDKGLCTHALAVSVHFAGRDDLGVLEALQAIVFLGGDTDTNAAIAAGLIATVKGPKALEEAAVMESVQTVFDCDDCAQRRSTLQKRHAIGEGAEDSKHQWVILKRPALYGIRSALDNLRKLFLREVEGRQAVTTKEGRL